MSTKRSIRFFCYDDTVCYDT